MSKPDNLSKILIISEVRAQNEASQLVFACLLSKALDVPQYLQAQRKVFLINYFKILNVMINIFICGYVTFYTFDVKLRNLDM